MENKVVVAALLLIAFLIPPASFAKPKVLGVAGVAYGVTVGVPIKIARDIFSETKRMTGTLESDFEVFQDPVISQTRLLIYFMTVPYGLLSGSILGTVHGVGNAFKYGYGEPFSKASVSLEEKEVAMKTLP